MIKTSRCSASRYIFVPWPPGLSNASKTPSTRPQEDERPADDQPTTAKRLAAEYHVDEKTIRRDGQYAEAVDTLAEALGPEVRHEVLAGRRKVTKPQVVKRAKSLQRLKHGPKAEDFTFMRGLDKWHQKDALTLLARLPPDEHALVNALLDQPGLPAKEMLDVILCRLPAQPPDARQRLNELHASPDPRDRARALSEAAGGTPILLPPLRQLKWAGERLQRALKNVDQCIQLDPVAPWTPRLQTLITQIQAVQKGELAQVLAEVQAYFEADPEADDPADEIVDDAEDSDGAVDQGVPELEVERDNAAASNCGTPIGTGPDSAPQGSAELEPEMPVCGSCGSNETWWAEMSGRIYCDDCHAVYNPSV